MRHGSRGKEIEEEARCGEIEEIKMRERTMRGR